MKNKPSTKKSIFTTLFVVAGIILAIAAPSVVAKPAGGGKPGGAVRLKPDLIVKSVKITRIGSAHGGGDRVRISAVVMNTTRETSTGVFKVQFDWTENPTRGWTFLNQVPVRGLSYSTTTAVSRPSKIVTAEYVVPAGKAYKFRVTADSRGIVLPPGNVDENNESNNTNAAGYSNL